MSGEPSAPVLVDLADDLRNAPALAGEAIAVVIYAALNGERQRCAIADVWYYGISVEMELLNGEFWAIECLGPDAFHFYPGIVREESVIWLNVWVAPDLSSDELVRHVNEVAAAARTGKKVL